MNRKLLSGRSRHSAAFSLVEVVLALGVVTFGLVVIMALIPESIHSSKQASEDMALSLIIQSTVTDLHKQGLARLAALTPSGTIQYYFDANGQLASQPDAYFGCVATPVPPSAAIAAPVNSTNFIYVQLQFSWPISAPAPNRQKSILMTSIGNYD